MKTVDENNCNVQTTKELISDMYKNVTMAQKCLEVFEKTVKTYPYSSEIENEKEIIEAIEDMGFDVK